MRKLRQINVTQLATIALLITLLTGIVILSVKNQLIADDFTQSQQYNSLTSHIYFNDSGRVSHGAFMQLFYTLFGPQFAIKIFPIFILSYLITIICLLVRQLSKDKLSVNYGIILALCLISVMPSLFDFSLFFAACLHSLTLVGSLSYILLLLKLSKNYGKSNRLYIIYGILATLTIFLGLLSEISLFIIPGILLLFAINNESPLKTSILYLPLLILEMVSFLVIYLSPGSSQRRIGNKIPIQTVLSGSLRDIGDLLFSSLSNPFFIILAISLAIISINIFTIRSNRRFNVSFSLFLLTISSLIILSANFSLGYTSMRLQNIAVFTFLLFCIFSTRLIALRYNITLGDRLQRLLFILSVTAIILTFTFRQFLPINRALDMRKDILLERFDLIKQNSSSDYVKILPAPLLLEETEAIDLSFYPLESPQGLWLYKSIIKYYNIENKTILWEKQPKDYCINIDVFNRFKEVEAKKCGTY